MIRRIALLLLALAVPGLALAQSQPLGFSGDFQAVDLGFNSKWWPGSTDTPDSSNPIQVLVQATAVASADADLDGTVALDGDTLTLGNGAGEWGYDFGAAITMQVAINLSFELNNPLPFGDDINIGPWVLDIPYAPDFDLVTSQRAIVNSFLLDAGSNLADTTEPVSVYDLSLVDLLIGDIDLPDWALDILGIDAGATLNVSFTTDATLSGEQIPLGDGNAFTSEGQALAVNANAPAYETSANYQENLDWDLTLNFAPAVFIDILGQRFELPIITIPWKVLEDRRNMDFTEAGIDLPVAPDPEGELEGEGEGVLEGEEEPIEFFTGCPAPCDVTFCVSPGANVAVTAAVDRAYAAQPIAVVVAKADLDGNGITDRAHASLLDSILASPEAANHCCILAAWEANYLAVEAMAGFGGDRAITDLQAAQLKVLAAFATYGEPQGYAYIETLADLLGWEIDLHQLDPSAGAYLAAQGDADDDLSCNLGEYDAVGGDLVSFVISATTGDITLPSESCELDCGAVGDGEGGEEEGEAPITWSLNIIEEGTGTGDIVVSPELEAYADGQVVTLSMFTGTNSVFFGWNGVLGIQVPGENGNEVIPVTGTNQYTIVMNGNKTIRPHFYLYAPIEGEDEGEPIEGEGEPTEGEVNHGSSADLDGDGLIDLNELLRLIQLYNAGAYYCDENEADGVTLEPGDRTCTFHTSDYSPADWSIQLSELLRLVQFYNLGGYVNCVNGEDGFCVAVR